MGTIVVKRPLRMPAPELPTGEIVLESPPPIPPPTGRRMAQTMMMLPTLAGSAGMALMFSGSGSRGAVGYVAGGMYGLSAIGMLGISAFTNSGQPTKQEMANQRRAYLRHLSVQRQRARQVIERQREALSYTHPDPQSLWATAASHRLWERRSGDSDFAVARIGLGPQALATPVVPPQTDDVEKLEPLCAVALRRFIRAYAIVPDLPIAMALNGFSRVYVRGDADPARAFARAVLAQAATFHAPDDLLIAVSTAPEARAEWEWVKWLPHAMHPDRHDRLGSLRMVTSSTASLEAMVDTLIESRPRFDPTDAAPLTSGPHLLVILDGGDTAGSDHLLAEGGIEGVTVIDLGTRPPRMLDRSSIVLSISGETFQSRTLDGEAELGTADGMSLAAAEALARQLAPLRLSAASRAEQPLTADLGLADLLDMGDPYDFDPVEAWRPRPNRSRLRVPIGITPDGTAVDLDLKESAQDGMGPHGLLIGATGSGKSELLRTLVLALAATHAPDTLNFVLVDFKGGATFTKLDRLPHTSAVITNLADELALVDRMTDALSGEIMRRQELLRAAGNYVSLWEYDKARAAGAPLTPVPSLIVVCDEFGELLSAKPDFIDMFVQMGRLGRALGVHLLLASQRLEEGRLRGLDSHLSYRIGLRTFSTVESRVVLGAPDAFELPRAPGHGYMKFGTEPMTRFRAAYVSGVHRRPGTFSPGDDGSVAEEILDFSTQYVAPQVRQEDETPEPEVGETLLDILVDRLSGKGSPARPVWLPPLKESPTLDELAGPLVIDEHRGLTVSDSTQQGTLHPRIGIIDRPFEQRRDPLELDLNGSAGHVAVIGAPQSGKSTALRSLICSLALAHTPTEVQIYCLDFGGGTLASLRELPHVGDIAGRKDVNRVRRTVAEIYSLLGYRETAFAESGIENMTAHRRALRMGAVAEPFGDVFLVVDGWATIRNDYEDLELAITDLANRGLNYGIHVVIAASRWMDVRQALRDALGTRIELRLGDPNDSYLGRRAANNVPDGAPGRGITAEQMHMLIALPRIDGVRDASELNSGVASLVAQVRQGWPGQPAPRVRLLPDKLRHDELEHAGVPHRFAIGVGETALQQVYADFSQDAHFLVFGDTESGKSTFLRALATSIVNACTPEQARVVLVDYRRSLLGSIGAPHLIGYGTSSASAQRAIAEAAGAIRERLPGPDITPAELQSRSWWRGPDLYVLVDDYDLVATGSESPLEPLLELLPHGRDVGLHVIVTRRSGGAGRALFEPVLARLRELGSPGILLSGERSEGALLGAVAAQAFPPGRGMFVTRRNPAELVQLAWIAPSL